MSFCSIVQYWCNIELNLQSIASKYYKMLLNTFTNIKTKRTASHVLGFFQYYSIRSTAMSSIEAVLRRNEAKFAITTQYYQYYQYHPIHSSFGTWLKNRQLPREARGQIGAEDILLSSLPKFFITSCAPAKCDGAAPASPLPTYWGVSGD